MGQQPQRNCLIPYWTELAPVGRLGEVDDLKGAIVYLASDFMTGHDLVIDGEYTVW